jgi:hypothetical protein
VYRRNHILISQRSPYVKTNGEWIANRIVTGLMIAPIEALPEIAVTDVVRIPSQWARQFNTPSMSSNCETSTLFCLSINIDKFLAILPLRFLGMYQY